MTAVKFTKPTGPYREGEEATFQDQHATIMLAKNIAYTSRTVTGSTTHATQVPGVTEHSTDVK